MSPFLRISRVHGMQPTDRTVEDGSYKPGTITSFHNQLPVEFVSNGHHLGMHPVLYGFEAIIRVTKKGKPKAFSDPKEFHKNYSANE